MKFRSLLFVGLFLTMGSLSIQGQPYYFLAPGSVSYRADGTDDPEFSPKLILRSPGYYGWENNGARTNWNSSDYLDFSLWTHPSNPNAYSDPSAIDTVDNNTPGAAKVQHWLMNFRMSYPQGFDPENPGTERYPVIVMMHGAGERGDCWNNNCYSTPPADSANWWNNDHNLVHGGRQHLQAQRNGRFQGFVIFPQNQNGWSSGEFGKFTYIWRVEVLLEELMKHYPMDRLRIYMHGLSNGAEASWRFTNSRPDLIAALGAMSGYSQKQAYPADNAQEETLLEETIVPIPLWQFQGGRDTKPSPSGTENVLRKIRNLGGTPRYYLYPNLGHATWNTAYNEPDFFEWFQQYDKTNIHAFYGVSEVCEGDAISVKLAVSKGFIDYQWEKEVGGVVEPVVIPSGDRKDYIFADEIGNYRVRIRYFDFYTDTEVWSDWSDWYEISQRPRPDATITANGPLALPGLNNATEVTLTAEDQDGVYYKWYKDGVVYQQDSAITNIVTNTPNEYHLVVTDAGLCESNPSNSLYVSTAPYSGNLPFAPSDLQTEVNGPNSINVYWQKNSTDELGFEIYRRENGNGGWKWIATTAAGAISFTDTGLNSGSEYCYRVRAYNENGASESTALAGNFCTSTPLDGMAPSAPANFTFDHFKYTDHRLNVVDELADVYYTVAMDTAVFSWDSANDNVGVTSYNIYREDGTLLGNTAGTTFMVPGLVDAETHGYYVTALDDGGNESVKSNSVTVTNALEGLYYNMYAGGTWDFVRDYSNWDLYVFSQTDRVRVDAGYEFYDQGDYFAYDMFGYIYIENAGNYQFRLSSDDGSQLYVGSEMVINHDGLHGTFPPLASDPIALTPGPVPITVKYFERSGGQSLKLFYSGPDTGNSFVEVPASAYRSTGTVPTITPPAAPTGLSATASGSEFSITLDWSYSGNAGDVRFEIWRSTDNINFITVGDTGYGDLTFTDTDLQASTTYYYQINAFNDNGPSETEGPANATTIGDNEAPTAPGSLAVQGVTSNSIVLTWNISTDNVGVAEYVVFMDGAEEGTTSNRTFTATDLTDDTDYSFYVVAKDASGNTSASSNTVIGRTDESGALPVELVSFEAFADGGQVLLKWVTASELNNEKFLVERGTNSGNFTVIGGMDGAGTTVNRTAYKWVDREPLDIAYYRLKQVDFDGTSTYSKVIRVVLDKSSYEDLTVFPNPTSKDKIFVRGFVPSNSDKVLVRLIDVMGKTYLNTVRDPNEFLNGMQLEPYQHMPVGVYILVLSDGSQVTQKRIVIK